MKKLFNVTLTPALSKPLTYAVAATNGDQAIERARIQCWKESNKWLKKSDMELTALSIIAENIVV